VALISESGGRIICTARLFYFNKLPLVSVIMLNLKQLKALISLRGLSLASNSLLIANNTNNSSVSCFIFHPPRNND